MAVLEKQTLELGDGIFIDVDPKSEFVRFRMGDDRKGVMVRKVDLWAVVFTIADPETQERLMPVRRTEMVTFRRIHNYVLKRDVRAGTKLRIPCEVNVPQTIEENLQGNLIKRQEKGGHVFVPGSGTPWAGKGG